MEIGLSVVGTDLQATQRLDSDTRRRASTVAARIAKLASRLPVGWPIGLEKNLFERPLAGVSAGATTGYLKRTGIKFVKEARPWIHGRPPSEYGVISLFKRMDEDPLAPEDVLTAVKLMGGKAQWCTAVATTEPFASGHYTEFFPPEQGMTAFAEMLAGVTRAGVPEDSIVRATTVYFSTTLFHVLRDGNGRAGRALLQCVLKADLGLTAPLFPLGPLFERNKESLLDAKHCWQREGDAAPLVRLVTDCLAVYCRIYERELSGSQRTG